jgi:erythromycin esterase-like protein
MERRRPMAERAGVYGLDLYNLSASLRAVLDYLDRVDPRPRRSPASATAA